MTLLNTSFTLPNGSVIKNRIAKSAMSENMSDPNHGPSDKIIKAYKTWANGGCGLIITGNVMIDFRAIGEPYNVVVEDRRHFEQLKVWAATVEGTGAHLWPQLNHPGRQALGTINKHIVAPSAIPVKVKGSAFVFKKPRALAESEIMDIIARFGNTAKIMKEAGFSGVQIHGAHGYLVSQFLSPLSNARNDKWGGKLENRVRFVVEVYRSIRENVGKDFPVGIKINSADFQRGGFTEEESMEVLKILSAEGIDLLEISGGTYEQPSMMGISKKKSTAAREAYFLDYVEKARKITSKPLMLTGGFRTVSVMENALAENKLDIIGIARPFTVYPNLPNEIFKEGREKLELSIPKTGLQVIDKMGFVYLFWHEMQIERLGRGKKPDFKLGPLAVMWYNTRQLVKKKMGGF